MDGKTNINPNKNNIKSGISKKNRLKIFYNNIIKSSKKPSSKISIFSSKLNNNKEKIRSKNNEMTLNNHTKKNSKKKQIITAQKEKIPRSSKNHMNQKINNKNNRKSRINKKEINNSLTFQNNIDKNNNCIKEKILSSNSFSKINKKVTKSLSISNPPIINGNSELEDIITSYEILPSELKTPKTISEDSFILDNKEKVKENTKENIKKDDNLLSNKTKVDFIPKIQKNAKTKNKKNLNLGDLNNNKKIKFNRIMSRTNIEEKNKPIQELKKNLSSHSIKFCLNQRLAKLKKIKNKNKLNKINAKIPINNNNIKKETEINKDCVGVEVKEDKNEKNEKDDILIKNIDLNKEKNENKRIQKEKIVFKINTKLIKNLDVNNISLNHNIKLIKENKNNKRNLNNENNSEIFYFKKNPKVLTKNNAKLALNIDNSNILFNNDSKLLKNFSGNNVIYAPKKGIKRQKSQEKNICNNMSYEPDKLKEIIKKRNNIRLNKKEAELGKGHFIEKNNSFCGNSDKLERIMMENNNNYNSPRINTTNKIPREEHRILNSENINSRLINNALNYINKTSEKVFEENNNIFLPNRFTTSEKVNYNKYMQNQDFNNSLNMGINLNTDSNNYNLNNIFNRRQFTNKLNIFPPNYNLQILSPFNNNINQTNFINLFNNNYLNFNTIQGKPFSFLDYNNYLVNESLYQNTNENINNISQSPSINIEDLIILQEKLKYIILALNKKHTVSNECFEFFNFYYNSSIYCQLEKSFTNPLESNNVRISINCTLISIIICYEYSFEKEIIGKINMALLTIIKLNYKNLIIIYDHILNKISKESKNNIWVKKLSNIINSYNKKELIKLSNISKISLINYNANVIFQNLILILRNYSTYRSGYILRFILNISSLSYSQINMFFLEYIFRTNNIKGSILASQLIRFGKNKKFVPIPNPYVRTKNNKNFSLVLDLDETLVHFKEKKNSEGNGILQIRPGVNEFLEEVGKFYELIIFTTATQDYADTLIDAIEEDKIYFEHRFYRNHAIIINNDFVKDLKRIGRPLDKIIIIDNMPQNFRLQKENGIMIKAFWGEDKYDTALYDLIPILVNIAKDGGDIRKGLVKYKEDILKKISSSISKDVL